MDRRKLLRSLGGVSVVGLAGCSSLRGVVRTGPPHFEFVELSGPDTAAVGEGLTLDLSVKNTGGKAGDFSTTLSIGTQNIGVTENVRVEDVPVGEERTVEIGPFPSFYSGQLTFRITDYGAVHTVSFTPVQAEIGEEIQLYNGEVAVGFSELEFLDSLFVERVIGSPYLLPRESGEVLAAAKVLLKDQRTQGAALSREEFELLGQEPLSPSGLPNISDVDILDGGSIPEVVEGGPQSGWLIFAVARSKLNGEVSLAWDRAASGTPEVEWIATEPPEGLRVPDISTEALSAPEKLEMGASGEVEITATNTGSGDGLFRDILQRRRAPSEDRDAGNWERVERLSEPVPSGQSRQIRIPISHSYVESFEYRLLDSAGGLETVEFAPLTIATGTSYTTPDGQQYTVQSEAISRTVTYSTGSGEKEQVQGEFGFVIFRIAAKKMKPDAAGLFGPTSFHLEAGGETYNNYAPLTLSEIAYVSPVEGRPYSPSISLTETADEAEGLILFEIPSGIGFDDIKLTLRGPASLAGDEIQVGWVPGGE